MPEAQMVDPHEVVMTGENSFIRLSGDGGKTIADRVSHWRVLWSPAGQGHALFIESPLAGKGPRLYADNAGVARFLQRSIEALLYKEFAAENGIGRVLLSASGNMDTELLFAGIFALVIIGVALFVLMEVLERIALPWHISQRRQTEPL